MALVLRNVLLDELLDRMYELKVTYDLPDRLLKLILSAYLSNDLSQNLFLSDLEPLFPVNENITCISIDVQQFSLNELSVKTDGIFVIIEGSHDEKEDEHGYIARSFKRRIKLPEEYDTDTVSAKLSSDGILSICAKKK